MGFWDVILFLPNCVRSLFVAPASEDIQSREDLIYEYGQAVLHIPQLLRRLAFRTRSLEEELQEAMLRGNLRKTFSLFDLIMLGLGIVIGGSMYVLMGQSVALFAGSAVLLSILYMGFACICAAACYAELCVELPIAGSAFTYVMVTFGELPAFITMGYLVIQYGMGMAAVARGFSRYIALICDLPIEIFSIEVGSFSLDYMAPVLVLILSLLLTFGIRETRLYISTIVIFKMSMILFVCIMGFVKSQGGIFLENFGLPQKGADGVFQAGAIMLFSYVAFDAVTIAVEEAQNVEDLPIAILSTVGISGFTYCLLAICLTVLITPAALMDCVDEMGVFVADLYQADTCVEPMDKICKNIPAIPAYRVSYLYAFRNSGIAWMKYIAVLSALFGIITALLVGLFSISRLVMVASREWLLPPILARISPRTQTPAIAQTVLGVIIAIAAMLVTYEALSQMVNFSALLTMWAVANTLLVRRYYPEVKMRYTQHGTVEAIEAAESTDVCRVPGLRSLSPQSKKIIVIVHMLLLNAVSIVFSIYYRLSGESADCTDTDTGKSGLDTLTGRHNDAAIVAFVAGWLVVTLSMLLFCPIEYEPTTWAIHRYLLPWVPSLAILLLSFSAGSLIQETYIYALAYLAGLLVVYVLFSMPLSFIRHFKLDDGQDDIEVEEIVYTDGKWRPIDEISMSGATTSMQGHPSGMSSYNPLMSVWSSNPSFLPGLGSGKKSGSVAMLSSGIVSPSPRKSGGQK